MAGLTPEQVHEWVVASCERQGVPVAVSDAATVHRVVVLLTGRAPQGLAAGEPAADGGSELPDRNDARRVERVGSGRVNDGVVEDGFDDGALSVEVERGPLMS